MKFSTLTEQSLAKLVHGFYARVRVDDLLGPIFEAAVSDWPEHLERLQSFWSSVMLTSGRYKGQPLAVHIRIGDAVTPAAFSRWLALWGETTTSLFEPQAATELQEKAARIADSLTLGIDFQRDPNGISGMKRQVKLKQIP
jgi:hemoglobin